MLSIYQFNTKLVLEYRIHYLAAFDHPFLHFLNLKI